MTVLGPYTRIHKMFKMALDLNRRDVEPLADWNIVRISQPQTSIGLT